MFLQIASAIDMPDLRTNPKAQEQYENHVAMRVKPDGYFQNLKEIQRYLLVSLERHDDQETRADILGEI